MSASAELNRPVLDETSLLQGVAQLAGLDPHLAGVVERYGPPPLWARPPGFGTLVYIILEQQVSLASARAAYTRLEQTAAPLTPASLLRLDDATMRAIGFSRQKAGYARKLAGLIEDGQIDLDALERMDDESARQILMRIPGVGRWTADIYLLMVLLRPDVWPHGDRALAVSVQRVKELSVCPSYAELETMSAAWQPWRAVAARLFWHDYLSQPAKGKRKAE